jgi:hypothetical protein
VENQVAVAKAHEGVIKKLAANDFHFTYGENLGFPDCSVPLEMFAWRSTRPPVCADLWFDPHRRPGESLTTIAKWRHHSADVALKGYDYDSKDVVWKDGVWRWSKHHEFLKFLHLPSKAAVPLEIAIASAEPRDIDMLQQAGWRTRPAESLNDPTVYRDYTLSSLGEFTVAKEQYVSPRSGWFSDRSVCYLGAGRPVITQETGFSKFIPTGEGLFAFTSEDEALDAIEAIAGNYGKHSAAALELAHTYFDAEKVVGQMLSSIGLL